MTPTKMKTIIAVYDEPVQVHRAIPNWTMDRINGWVDFKTNDPWGFTKIIRAHHHDHPCRLDVSIRHEGNQEQRQPGVVRIYNRLLKLLIAIEKITFREE